MTDYQRPGRRTKPSRAILFALATLAIVCAACSGSAGDRPSVLLITLDTTRADRLGCYGYDKETSPVLDRFAAEGVLFDFAIAQAAVTPVSHASILTGLNPYGHGVRVIHGKAGYRLDESIPSLTSVLKEQGFDTAGFVSAFPVSEYYGFENDFDRFETGIDDAAQKEGRIDEEGHFTWGTSRNQRRADETTDQCLAWLEQRDGPFFLWLHYFDPHDDRVLPPRKMLKKFEAGAQSLEEYRKEVYDAEVRFLDHQIGRIFASLKASGRYEDTVIVVVADHGQGLGDHGWWYHRVLYQEQIRVPLIVKTPDSPRGARVEALVRTIDIFPTVLDAVGLAVPSGLDGKSLLGLMRGDKEPPRFAYADAINLLDNNVGDVLQNAFKDLMYCVMDRRWKLIHHEFRPELNELYNLEDDPLELNNVREQHPEQYKKMMKLLDQTGGKIQEIIEAAPENMEALERLKALGYGY